MEQNIFDYLEEMYDLNTEYQNKYNGLEKFIEHYIKSTFHNLDDSLELEHLGDKLIGVIYPDIKLDFEDKKIEIIII